MKVKRTYNLNKMAESFEQKYGPRIINDVRDAVHKDILDGVRAGKDLDNSNTAPLKEATVKAKKAKGYKEPSLPRVATGSMTGALGVGGPFVSQKAKPGNLKSILRTAARAFYGKYQQIKRKWWGIAKRTRPSISKIVRVNTVKMLKSAHTGRAR